MSKEYGLILPSQNKPSTLSPIKKPPIFQSDSDSDGGSSKPTGLQRSLKRQERVIQQKAVEEDPTVYQYDEIYDEMDQKRKDTSTSSKDATKKSKYISKLMVAADRRKRENERRIERQVQKEREAEGEEFKDKESFVTSAYKKKMEEMRLLEEQEKHEDYLESIGDVRKQGNLDGFYRHLYEQKLNVKDEMTIDDDIKRITPVAIAKSDNKTRHYRKRKVSNSDDEEQTGEETKGHLVSNLDADSDFSIDSESDSKEEPMPKVVKVDDVKIDEKPVILPVKEESAKDEVEIEKPKPVKNKIDIWKKRTVAVIFDEALQRYYERKALRESG